MKGRNVSIILATCHTAVVKDKELRTGVGVEVNGDKDGWHKAQGCDMSRTRENIWQTR